MQATENKEEHWTNCIQRKLAGSGEEPVDRYSAMKNKTSIQNRLERNITIQKEYSAYCNKCIHMLTILRACKMATHFRTKRQKTKSALSRAEIEKILKSKYWLNSQHECYRARWDENGINRCVRPKKAESSVSLYIVVNYMP